MSGKANRKTGPGTAHPVVDEAPPEDPETTQDSPASDEAPATPEPVTASTATLTTDGDLTLADHGHLLESVEAGGRVRLGDHARVDGDVTARGNLEVGEGTRIRGTLRVHGSTQWGKGAEAAEVKTDGPFTTHDGAQRATSLHARHGIHHGTPPPKTRRQEGDEP